VRRYGNAFAVLPLSTMLLAGLILNKLNSMEYLEVTWEGKWF
jgi:hypothetical protein